MRDQLRQEGDRREDEEGRGGVLGELSLSAIVASALAAATSFALSSRIGLAGSIIGVAVAAGASALAAQVYKGMIKASAQKLKDLSYDRDDDSDAAWSGAPLPGHDGNTSAMPAAVQAPPQGEPERSFAATGTPIAPASLHSAAARQQGRRVARRAAVVLAAVAVLAVLAYAAVVSLVTAGQGIGPSIDEVAQSVTSEQPAAQSVQGESDATNSTEGDASSQEGTKSEATGSTTTAPSTEGGTSAKDPSTEAGAGTSGSGTAGTSGSSDSGPAGTGSSSGGASGSGSSGSSANSSGGSTSSSAASSDAGGSGTNGSSSGTGTGSSSAGSSAGSATGSTSGTAAGSGK